MDFYNNKENIISKNNKFLTINNTFKNKDLLSRKNFSSVKDKFIKKHSSYEPKVFRRKYLGPEIILPSNQLN